MWSLLGGGCVQDGSVSLFLVFMICHLEAAIWKSGIPSEIGSGSAPRKVSGSGIQPASCLRRMFVLAGGVVIVPANSCATTAKRCAGRMSYAIVMEDFFFLSFFVSVLNREIHIACVFQVLTAVQLCFLHRSFSQGDETSE